MSGHEKAVKGVGTTVGIATPRHTLVPGKQTGVSDSALVGASPQEYAQGSVFAVGKVPWQQREKPGIAAPDEIDFGDIEVGETKFENTHVFNQHDVAAGMRVNLDAPPTLRLVEHPSVLRPTRDGFDPTAAIRIAYTPRTNAVENGSLSVTLRWPDGSEETRRIIVRAAAHGRSESTHAEQDAQASKAKQDQAVHDKQAALAAEHEVKVQAAEKRLGSFQPQIELAYNKLMNAAEEFFANQEAGVNASASKVSLYSRRQAVTAIDPPIALALAKAALEMATGRLSVLVSVAFDRLKPPEKFKQWEKGATANVPSSMLGGFSAIVGNALTYGKNAIAGHLTWEAPVALDDQPNAETRVDFFTAQAVALHASRRERKDLLVDVERALLPLNTLHDAPYAAMILNALREAFSSNAINATKQQELETTRHWARFLSQASLGSMDAAAARQRGLKPSQDGSATANMDKALRSSGQHGGLLDVEFSGDITHPEHDIAYTAARLFGMSRASVKSLELEKTALVASRLPIRLRSSARSAPLAVTITRDEAGNILFADESGTPGMQTRWLSRRAGGKGDAAAYRAAREMMEKLQTKTLAQIGVALELDDA